MGDNYLYVGMFATAPEYQGCGCGSILIKFLGEVADADNVISYLETAGEKNIGFYNKKGGYAEVDRKPIGDFTAEGGAAAMIRPVMGSGNMSETQFFTKIGIN